MKNLYLIDDDVDDLDILSEVIERFHPDFQFQKFTDAQSALARLNQPGAIKPDYVFTDVNMPGIDGIQCLKLLREVYPSQALNVIVLSTSMPDSLRSELLRLGANEAFQKPISFKAYESLMGKILGEKSVL